MTRHLAGPVSLEQILENVIDSALQVLDAERGTVFLYDPKTNELYTKVSTGAAATGQPGDGPGVEPPSISHDIRIPADRGIAGETAQKRELINVPDCYADPRFNRDVDRKTGYRTRCLLSIPLLGVDETLVGVLQVLNKRNGVFDEDDRAIASTMAAHCAVALQRAMLLEEYVVKQRMQRELALAREIQLGALPKELPRLDGYEVAAWSKPAEETGGDIYDAVSIDDRRAAILLADATGHGVGPALSVSQLRAMFRMGILLGADINDVFSRINVQAKADLPAGCLVTAFAGILDTSSHKIHYHSGGQAPLLHYHALTDQVEWLDASAIPIGILAQPPLVPPAPLEMGAGDVFALISDGFFEYHDRSGEMFGRERVGDLFRSNRESPPEQLINLLREAVARFAEGAAQDDDMTIVVVRRNS